MGTTGHSSTEVRNPGPYQVSGAIKAVFGIFLAGGVAAFLITLKQDPARAWASFVQNHFYFMSLALGGLFFAAIQWLTGAMWSAPIRRLSESLTSYLPVSLVTFGVLLLGVHTLYHWSHPEAVKGDLILEGKQGYLNVKFFVIRGVVAIALWAGLAWKMVGNSLKQDSTKDGALTSKNRALAPLFLVLFAISFTLVSMDTLMSLDPHWFSTMFGVYCFAGMFYSTLAVVGILASRLYANGTLKGIVNENHLHDLGKFMFAFSVFWAYIAFSQYMLIWYANLPEETPYFIRRFEGAWMWVTAALLLAKFVVPFFLLIARGAKRNPMILTVAGVWMLLAHWLDLVWVVQPEFFAEGPKVGMTEIAVFLGFFGLFGLVVSRFLGKNNVVAIGDPALAHSVHHHHQ